MPDPRERISTLQAAIKVTDPFDRETGCVLDFVHAALTAAKAAADLIMAQPCEPDFETHRVTRAQTAAHRAAYEYMLATAAAYCQLSEDPPS